MVIQGVQQGFDLLVWVMFDFGDLVVVEEFGYLLVCVSLLVIGVEVCGVLVDVEGLCVDLLLDNVKLVYVILLYQFLLGMLMSLEWCLQLLDWVQCYWVLIIEDDYDSEYCFDGCLLELLCSFDWNGQVVYFGIFFKIFFFELCFGYLLLLVSLCEVVLVVCKLVDWYSEILQ